MKVSGLVKSFASDPLEHSLQGLCRNQNFKLESLILAQNERWRQA